MKYIKTTTTNEKRIFDSEKLASEIYDYIYNYYVGMQLSDEANKWYEVFSNNGVLETLQKEYEAEDFDNVFELFYEYGNEDWLCCGKISDEFEDFYLKFIEKFNIQNFGSASPMENAKDIIEYYIDSNKPLAKYDKWSVSLINNTIVLQCLFPYNYCYCEFTNDEDGFDWLNDFFSNCKKYDLPLNTPMYEMYSNLIDSKIVEYVAIDDGNTIEFELKDWKGLFVVWYSPEDDEYHFSNSILAMEWKYKDCTAFDAFAQFYADFNK